MKGLVRQMMKDDDLAYIVRHIKDALKCFSEIRKVLKDEYMLDSHKVHVIKELVKEFENG